MTAVETACADHWAARLAQSHGAAEIEALCAECAGNEGLMNMVYQLMDSADSRTATNALWLLNHLPKSEDAWLETHRADLIARTVAEEVGGRRRMLLCLVSRLPFGVDDVRIDLLNFCFDHALQPRETAACRALCVKLAYELCRHYPELLRELHITLREMMLDPLPPSVASAVMSVKRHLPKTWKV